jgi:hypothetical protein
MPDCPERLDNQKRSPNFTKTGSPNNHCQIMKSLTICLILVWIVSCQTGDEYTGVYAVRGKIKFDNGQIAGTSQIFLNNELKTTTDSDGDFILNELLICFTHVIVFLYLSEL